jgi:CRP/FNR family transcriptional regulator, cyclic AMP receptor protein
MSESTRLHKVLVCKKGDYLFKQNEVTKDLYIVKTGRVRVYKMEGGVEIELDLIGPGGIIGEIAAIDGGSRSASVIALEDTEAFIITPEEFKTLTAKIPEWFQKIAMILAHRLREADGRIDRNMESDKTSHVAAAISLISYSDRCKPCEGGMEINPKTLENEVVDLLNIKFSEVVSAVEKLEKQGLLASEKGKVIIRSRERLEEIARAVFKTPAVVPET